ncbi:mucin-17-like isoform X1 [Lithobates pipiens]
MKLSSMTVMLLVAMIGNNTATLTTTAQLSLSTKEATIIAQTTTEATNTTPASNTASTSTTNITTASNTENIKTTSTSSLTTTTSNIRTPSFLACQNGGIYENYICYCPSNFEGKFCEIIKNIITVDNGTTASLNVVLRITNMVFTEDLKDNTSEEYKKFENDFKRHMSIVYLSVAGFEDVKILSISAGSIIVHHEVIVRFLYNHGVTIADQFKEALEDVKENMVELSKNCDANSEMCIDDHFAVIAGMEPISPEELCRQNVEEGFQDFFTPEFENGILICVSHCGEISPHFKDCHEGTCQIEKWSGPRCSCPGGDRYLYTDNQCGGRILKLGLFIGGGVVLGVLVIITITVGICLYRAKSQKAPRNELFYETIE